MNKDERIKQKLKEQYESLSKDHVVFGVFLYGSQNYGCDTEESDIDTKAIIIPSIDDLIFRRPVSTQRKTDCGECDIKDIREMFTMFRKQNVNYLEILFTDYFYVPMEYADYYAKLRDMSNEVARYDEKHAVSCILGLYNRELSRMYKDCEDVEKHGYSRKSYSNAIRLHNTMRKYTEGEKDYKKVISNSDCKQYKKRFLPIGMVEENVSIMNENMEKMFEEFKADTVHEEVKEKMDALMKEIITRNWKMNVI